MAEEPERGAALLADARVRARLRGECDRYWRFIHRGEWHRVRVMSSTTYPEVNGHTFAEIAALWEQDPWDCYFDLLAAAGTGDRRVERDGACSSPTSTWPR